MRIDLNETKKRLVAPSSKVTVQTVNLKIKYEKRWIL